MITYNIIYDKTLDLEQLKTSIESTGATINKTFSNIGVINLTSDNLDFISVDGVVAHEEDLILTTELQSEPWHRLRISKKNLPLGEIYVPPNKGTNVVVYLVDTAIDTTHSEFVSSSITNLWSYNNDFTPHSHGTAVASVIVGETLGVSTEVQLKSVVIPVGQTQVSYLVEAFDVIIQDHDETTPSVVNCSWLIDRSLILDTKLLELQGDNIVVVAAAGNYGLSANDYSPVGLDTVLGVGASDAYDRVISWDAGAIMNYGPDVDVTAPGIDISVASIDGTIRESSGTSLACGIVSGIVYGTTPNLLIFNEGKQQLFDLEGTTENYVQVNNTIEYIVQADPLVKNVKVENFYVVGELVVLPEWVTFSDQDRKFIFSPDGTVSPNMYKFYMQGLDSDSQVISRASVYCGVWLDSPDDIGDGVTRNYYYNEETGEVNVRLQACTNQGASCFTNTQCFGKNCQCGAFSPGQCGTVV
jgi:subtilisin family serine protease